MVSRVNDNVCPEIPQESCLGLTPSDRYDLSAKHFSHLL